MDDSWRVLEIGGLSKIRVVNVLDLVGQIVPDFETPFEKFSKVSIRSPDWCSYDTTAGLLLARVSLLGSQDISWIESSKFLRKFNTKKCRLRQLADPNTVLGEFSKDERAVETLERWLDMKQRVALVTGILVEEWGQWNRDTQASAGSTHRLTDNITGLFRKRTVQTAFRFKPITSADFDLMIKGPSQTSHSNPYKLSKAPSLDKPSLKAPLIAPSTQASSLHTSLQASPLIKDARIESPCAQTSPLRQPPLERAVSEKSWISEMEHNTHEGTKLPLSDSRSSSTKQFCARVERAVLSVVSSNLVPASAQLNMTTSCLCEWDLPLFLQKNFEFNQKISSVITLVGAMPAYDGYATTCSEYISQTWPDGGPVLLQAIEELFQTTTSQEIQVKDGDLHIRLALSVRVRGKNLWVLVVTGPPRLQVEVAQTLCWLAATFRSSPFATIAESRVVFQASSAPMKQGTDFILSLEDLDRLPDLAMCWPPLFTHTPMAVQFPVPQKKEGTGLEISPLLMTRLAGIVMAVEFQGGLILKGLSTALIPVKYCNDGAAVQWHLLHTQSADGFLEELGTAEDFVKVQDLTILFQKTAYLGWCKDASILLGTSVFDHTAVNWSTPAPERSKITVSGFSLGLASNGLGFFGPSATMNFTVAKSQRTRYVDIEQQLEDRLKLSVTKPVLIYDTSTQRAWLVPVTCLLLQMMHLRYHQMGSRVPYNSTSAMPYAKSTVEGGYEAYQILVRHLQPGLSTALGSQMVWRDTLARLYTGLDMALKNASEFKTRPRQDETEIFGFELLDIVLADSPFRLSQRKVQKQSGGWAPVGQHVGYVLFCSHLGEVLIPSPMSQNDRLCKHCSTLPSGCDYLSAYVPCFQETLLRQGEHAVSKLLGNVEYEKSLYHDCIGTNGEQCIPLHTYDSLFQASKEASISTTARAPDEISKGGAIVIGKRTKLSKRNLSIIPDGYQGTDRTPITPNGSRAIITEPTTSNGNHATAPTKKLKTILRRVLYRLRVLRQLGPK